MNNREHFLNQILLDTGSFDQRIVDNGGYALIKQVTNTQLELWTGSIISRRGSTASTPAPRCRRR